MEFAEDLEMILSMLNEEPTSNPELGTLNPHQLLDSHETIPHEESCTRIDHLAPGLRFVPTDQELICYYLKKKINNEQIPYEYIPTINIYMHNPQELTAAYPSLGNNEWYFFTPRNRKYPNGSRPNRAAGSGYWKATVADKPIYEDNVFIGFKKTLVFYQGKKTNWIMHEYTLGQPSKQQEGTNDMLLDNVLCRIYKRTHGAAKADQETLYH